MNILNMDTMSWEPASPTATPPPTPTVDSAKGEGVFDILGDIAGELYQYVGRPAIEGFGASLSEGLTPANEQRERDNLASIERANASAMAQVAQAAASVQSFVLVGGAVVLGVWGIKKLLF